MNLTVIYIDVLIILNFYVTFFLVKATACFLHIKTRNFRVFCGSILGSISSLVILLPELNSVLNIAIKLALAFLIILSVFGFGSLKSYIKHTLFFFIINIIFAGVMLLLWLFSAPLGMRYNNCVPYFDISFLTIVISTALAYIVLRIFRTIADRQELFDKKYTLQIINHGQSTEVSAIADTGNSLVDYFSGLPIVIVDCDALLNVVSPTILEFKNKDLINVVEMPKNARIIPYSTINGSSFITVTSVEKLIISDGEKQKNVNALIGISKEKIEHEKAIFNPKILN